MTLAPVAAHGVDTDLRAQSPVARGTLVDIWREAEIKNVLYLEVSDLQHNKRLPLEVKRDFVVKQTSSWNTTIAIEAGAFGLELWASCTIRIINTPGILSVNIV